MKNVARDIPGHEGRYRVTRDGEVLSCCKGGVWKRLKPILADRYFQVALYKNKKPKRVLLHRLVLETFVGPCPPCPPGMTARHFPDRSRTNNRLSNLSWSTPKDNIGDKVFHGTYINGDRCHKAKLDWKRVRLARKLFATGRYKHTELSQLFGISPVAMGHIVRNETWKKKL